MTDTPSDVAVQEPPGYQRHFPPGSYFVTEITEVFDLMVDAWLADPKSYVKVEQWVDISRDRENRLVEVEAYKVTTSGEIFGYSSREYLLDDAAPRFPTRHWDMGYPDGRQNTPARIRVGGLLDMSEIRDAEGAMHATRTNALATELGPGEYPPADDDMTVIPLPVQFHGQPIAMVPEMGSEMGPPPVASDAADVPADTLEPPAPPAPPPPDEAG